MSRTHADDDDIRPQTVESAIDQEDRQRAVDHKLDRMAPARRSVWPKDDRRSSERMAEPGATLPAPRPDDLPERGSDGDQPLG